MVNIFIFRLFVCLWTTDIETNVPFYLGRNGAAGDSSHLPRYVGALFVMVCELWPFKVIAEKTGASWPHYALWMSGRLAPMPFDAECPVRHFDAVTMATGSLKSVTHVVSQF